MAAAVAAVEEAEGAVGALVNNAGYSQSGAVESVPLDSVRAQFETNVFGLVRMCQLVLPGMRRAGRGRIVNVSSMGGKLVFPGGGIYHATKHAVEAVSDAMRYRGQGLRGPGGGDRARADQDELRGDGGGRDARGRRPVRGLQQVGRPRPPRAPTRARSARLGAGPEAVAKAISRALSAKKPRTRYPVTASARLLLTQRKLLPDRAWDAVAGASFRRPGS